MAQRDPNFSYLLIGLMLYLLIGPIAREIFGEMDGFVLLAALCSVLLLGVYGLQESKLIFYTGLTLALIAISLTIGGRFAESDTLKLIVMADVFLFFAMAMGLAINSLFGKGPITLNRLIGGICVFLLLGMCWSIVYMYLYWWNPDAFSGALLDTQDNPVYWDMIYFSFVTLTTLGYGDITPAGPVARSLAYTEAIVGQLFIAILIGSLVGNLGSKLRDD
jgi:voltage-gated potassium channel